MDEAAFAAGISAGTPLMAEDPTSGQLLIAQMAPGTRTLASSATVTPPVSITANAVAQTTVGASSGQILAANAAAKGRSIQNTGTVTIYLGLGKTPTATAYHPRSLRHPQVRVACYCAGAGGTRTDPHLPHAASQLHHYRHGDPNHPGHRARRNHAVPVLRYRGAHADSSYRNHASDSDRANIARDRTATVCGWRGSGRRSRATRWPLRTDTDYALVRGSRKPIRARSMDAQPAAARYRQERRYLHVALSLSWEPGAELTYETVYRSPTCNRGTTGSQPDTLKRATIPRVRLLISQALL